MEENDSNVFLLEYALEQTDSIINMFEDCLRTGISKNDHEKRNFNKTACDIIGIKNGNIVNGYTNISDLNTDLEEKANVKNPEVYVDKRSQMSFEKLLDEALECKRCRLCETRKHVVFGEGCTKDPLVFVVGEGPGETEDDEGLPFVGKAGKFLDAWLNAISLDRTRNCYISNIVKCRPPMNRDPQLDERVCCKPFLDQQIALLHPKAILCLGKSASSIMTGKLDDSMAKLHGKFSLYNGDIPIICTYHPAAVLRDMSLKRPVWEDLQKLARFLVLPISGKK